jgi:hypothetical protein
MVLSPLKGDAHINVSAEGFIPFAFGDVDPDGPFVHIFDETALDIVLRELDTITDFVRYLNQREAAIRGDRIVHAPSEADLLAFYLQCEDENQRPHFSGPCSNTRDKRIRDRSGSRGVQCLCRRSAISAREG